MSKFSLNYLGYFFLLTSLLLFFNIIYCYYLDVLLSIDAFIYTIIISLTVSFALLIQKKKDFKVTIYEKIVSVILGYLLIPLLISVPYYLGNYNITFVDSYFESISGFTSTGFTIFENIKHLDQSLVLWRSTSQWIGGLYFLFSIIMLIDIFDNNLKKSLTNFLSFSTSETLKQSIKVLILYTFLTIFIFLVLKIINLRTFDSFNLALTIISSGGFLPFNNIETVLNTDFKRIVFSILMLFSFFGIFSIYNLIFFKKKNLNFFSEDLILLFYFVFLVFLFLIFFRLEHNFSYVLFSITSSISNIGISFDKIPNNINFIFLLLVIIGGSFFSTSSGLRLVKVYSLIKFSVNELLSHSKPNHIFKNRVLFTEFFTTRPENEKYFLTVLIFILSLFSLNFLLTIGGINFEEAFKIGILTLMNTVNSSMYGIDEFNFYYITDYNKFVLMAFMIIGRVELLTILILLKKFLLNN